MNIYPPGTKIANRLEIVSYPKIGGMGVVYFCIDQVENKPRAIKTIRSEFLSDRGTRDLFLREGTSWMNLGVHPNIVQCYRVIEDSESNPEIFLVLELISTYHDRADASLRSWLASRQPLPIQTAIAFSIQCVRGMKHVCKQVPGLVHRDLKPENILVGAEQMAGWNVNQVRITDFGLAAVFQNYTKTTVPLQKSLDPMARTQLVQGVAGTPFYMAPEQWKNEKLGTYTDIYAFGCIFAEMLTGKLPIEGNNIRELQASHCKGQIKKLPNHFPLEVRSLFDRCVAIRSTDRYQSWEDLEKDLNTLYQDIAGTNVPEPTRKVKTEEGAVTKGWSYITIGKSYFTMGEVTVAQKYGESSLEIALASKDKDLQVGSLNLLSGVYRVLGNMKSAVDAAETVVTLATDSREKAGGLGNLGIIYGDFGQPQKAIGYFDQVLDLAHEINDQDVEMKAFGNLSVLHKQLGNFKKAVQYAKQALEYTKLQGDLRGECLQLLNLGSAYIEAGNANDSLKHYKQALDIARQIGARKEEGDILSGLSACYFRGRNISQAISCSQEALAIYKEIGDRGGEGSTLGNLANAYASLGRIPEAKQSYEEALAIAKSIGNRMAEAAMYMNLGVLFAQAGNPGDAVDYCRKAEVIYNEMGNVDLANRVRSFRMIAEKSLGNARGGNLSNPDPNAIIVEMMNHGLDAFLQAQTKDEMSNAVKQNPVMISPEFIARLERLGWFEFSFRRKAALKEKISWLRDVSAGR
jgi:serine/threonine protein kinase